MQGDDPPYLSVGTAVSAKYKGAFCEAKVSKVVRVVKCKVTYKMGLGVGIVSDEQIKGPLRVGATVQVRHPDRKENLDATITKIQDCSQYTVVFDDGDITTLRRTALCLKSGRHFNESETLDQLPLTHPEHFSTPVVVGRRGRRSRQLKDDSSEGEVEEENEPDLETYAMEVGRVVCVEASDKKRNKDNWFPGLVVMPSAQPTVRINAKDEFLVRSFKDGRYYTVPQKEVTEFARDVTVKGENSSLAEAVEKTLRYLDKDELPVHWERSLLFSSSVPGPSSESDENLTDSSEDETPEEKDHFVAQLYKFMDDSNTPLNKSPVVAGKDVDLHKLFRVVRKLGGCNRVTNKSKWRSVTLRLKLPNNLSTFNQVKQVYKKCLLSYEAFHRTLGVTMLSHPRNAKKSRGRSLIRDKDRSTPVNSPRPEKDEESDKKEDEKPTTSSSSIEDKTKTVKKEKDTKIVKQQQEEEKKRKDTSEISDTNSSDTTDLSESGTSRPRRNEFKLNKDKIIKAAAGNKVQVLVQRYEEQVKKEKGEKEKEAEKVQQTRSKTQIPKPKEVKEVVKEKEKEAPSEKKVKEVKVAGRETPNKSPIKIIKKIEEDKKRGRKRLVTDDKTSLSDSSTTDSSNTQQPSVNVGDKLKVYYGPTHESKVTYEAKVIEIDKDAVGPIFLVHYTGWNTRYDEWIMPVRIAENLSATTKAKRLKQTNSPSGSKGTPKLPTKRGRGMSITGRSTAQDPPRSTTPSVVTPTSSRTKSPSTTTARTIVPGRPGETARRTRRTSLQTELLVHSESDSGDASESETDGSKKGPAKNEEPKPRVYRKRMVKSPFMKAKDAAAEKDDDETEKEEEVPERPRRTRKLKKTSESKSVDSDEDGSSPPKGRDFDLNQIRNELKGFSKAVKLSSDEAPNDKEMLSSDDSTQLPDVTKTIEEAEEEQGEPDKDKEVVVEKSENTTSDDIYEFKEPEPFEFESKKRLMPRIFEEMEKSPKKKGKTSPSKFDMKEDKNKRTPKKSESEENDSDAEERLTIEDPFDKLVESPSFHSGKAKGALPPLLENKQNVTKNLDLDEPLSIFNDLAESTEEDSQIDISDNDESQSSEPLFTHKDSIFPHSTFSKESPSDSALDSIFKDFGTKSDKHKDSDDDDDIMRASIENAINQTSITDDDDSNDELTINQAFLPFLGEKEGNKSSRSVTSFSDDPETEDDFNNSKIKPKAEENEKKEIPHVLLENDAAPSQPKSEILTKFEEATEIIMKPTTKIVDTILEKFGITDIEVTEEKPTTSEIKEDIKTIVLEPPVKTEINEVLEHVPKSPEAKTDVEFKTKQLQAKPKTPEPRFKTSPIRNEPASECRKRPRKILSREFIEETDSESSDSQERLVIARSDEESQTNSSLDEKSKLKELLDQVSSAAEEETAELPESSFKFEAIQKKQQDDVPKLEAKTETAAKDEEADSHLHSLLLCEETIPGSPAPAPEAPIVLEVRPKAKSVLEMPFASAPGSSNNKLEPPTREIKTGIKERVQPPPMPMQLDNRDRDVSTVLDNTPPTTPESTLSNLSPRGDPGDLSPTNTADESCKSLEGDGDYSIQRKNAAKLSLFNEEDSLLNPESSLLGKKLQDDPMPASCRKRRRSCKGLDDVTLKKCRKALNRSRHNSDSDDTSEHSISGNLLLQSSSSSERLNRSPKPSKYNFYVELDPSLDSAARIAILQQKLQDIRKTYANVKAELATVERRRKKLRRREREAKLAAKQEALAT